MERICDGVSARTRTMQKCPWAYDNAPYLPGKIWEIMNKGPLYMRCVACRCTTCRHVLAHVQHAQSVDFDPNAYTRRSIGDHETRKIIATLMSDPPVHNHGMTYKQATHVLGEYTPLDIGPPALPRTEKVWDGNTERSMAAYAARSGRG